MVFGNETSVFTVFQGLGLGLDFIDSVQHIGFADYFEFRVTVHQDAQYIEIVIGPFCTVDNRTSFYSDTSTVGFHLVVGFHGTRFHIEVHFHLVAFLPFAVDGEITLLQVGVHFFAIYFHAVFRTQSVGIRIQVAWHHLILYPSRYTYLHGKLSGTVAVYSDGDITVPRIRSGLCQFYFLAVHLQGRVVRHEEVDIYIAVFYGIDISRQ